VAGLSLFSVRETAVVTVDDSDAPSVLAFEAGVVLLLCDGKPVGAVDAPVVCRARPDGEGGGNLDPAVLLLRNVANLVGHVDEILILTDDQGHVILAIASQPDDVERHADVDPFLFTNSDGVVRAIRQCDAAVAIPQRSGVDVDRLMFHPAQLLRPEPVPRRTVR